MCGRPGEDPRATFHEGDLHALAARGRAPSTSGLRDRSRTRGGHRRPVPRVPRARASPGGHLVVSDTRRPDRGDQVCPSVRRLGNRRQDGELGTSPCIRVVRATTSRRRASPLGFQVRGARPPCVPWPFWTNQGGRSTTAKRPRRRLRTRPTSGRCTPRRSRPPTQAWARQVVFDHLALSAFVQLSVVARSGVERVRRAARVERPRQREDALGLRRHVRPSPSAMRPGRRGHASRASSRRRCRGRRGPWSGRARRRAHARRRS